MVEAGLLYRRGQLIRIKPEGSSRVGVPKDRCWLILQSDEVKERTDFVACYITSTLNEKGEKKYKRRTDASLKKGTKIGREETIRENSYIRCQELRVLHVNEIEAYVGRLPDIVMSSVDEKLRILLALPARLDAVQQIALRFRVPEKRI